MSIDDVTVEEAATPESVIQIRTAVEAQNAELIGRLRLIGKTPTPALFTNVQMQTLIDFVFQGDEDALNAYETACGIRINAALKDAIEQYASGLLAPTE